MNPPTLYINVIEEIKVVDVVVTTKIVKDREPVEYTTTGPLVTWNFDCPSATVSTTLKWKPSMARAPSFYSISNSHTQTATYSM